MINGIPRLLIIRFGAVGDVVRVLPASHAIRQMLPNAQIDWVVDRKAAEIVDGRPELDTVVVFDRPEGFQASAKAFVRLCNQIRAARYDVVMDFHGVFRSGAAALWSGAPDRYGFARPRAREGSWLFTTKRVKLPAGILNRVEENMLLCDSLGQRPAQIGIDASVEVPEDVQEHVNAFLEEAFHGGKWIVIMHPAVDRPEKQWPIERFAELADLLISDGRFEVVITWGPGQFHIAQEVARKARRNPRIAPESPDLKHFAWLVHCADLYFGGDTGPMHIAWGMGTPVVAVFGGTDPARHAPFRGPYEVLGRKPGEVRGRNLARYDAKRYLAAVTSEMAYDACVRMLLQVAERA